MVARHVCWRKVVRSIEDIVNAGCYAKVNRVISLTLDSYLRNIAVKIVKGYRVILDSGCGPGLSLGELLRNEVACLDPSLTLLKMSRTGHSYSHHICGVAEAIPLRQGSVDAVLSLFSLRDFRDREKAVREYERVAKSRIVIVDIFKPVNPILRVLAGIYLSYLAPLMAMAIAGKIGYKWRLLYDTYITMITPSSLKGVLRRFKEARAISFVGGLLSLIDLVKK